MTLAVVNLSCTIDNQVTPLTPATETRVSWVTVC